MHCSGVRMHSGSIGTGMCCRAQFFQCYPLSVGADNHSKKCKQFPKLNPHQVCRQNLPSYQSESPDCGEQTSQLFFRICLSCHILKTPTGHMSTSVLDPAFGILLQLSATVWRVGDKFYSSAGGITSTSLQTRAPLASQTMRSIFLVIFSSPVKWVSQATVTYTLDLCENTNFEPRSRQAFLFYILVRVSS